MGNGSRPAKPQMHPDPSHSEVPATADQSTLNAKERPHDRFDAGGRVYIWRDGRGWIGLATVTALSDHPIQVHQSRPMSTTEKYQVCRAASPQTESAENSVEETPEESPVPPPTEPSENREADQRAQRPSRPSRSRDAERLALGRDDSHGTFSALATEEPLTHTWQQ